MGKAKTAGGKVIAGWACVCFVALFVASEAACGGGAAGAVGAASVVGGQVIAFGGGWKDGGGSSARPTVFDKLPAADDAALSAPLGVSGWARRWEELSIHSGGEYEGAFTDGKGNEVRVSMYADLKSAFISDNEAIVKGLRNGDKGALSGSEEVEIEGVGKVIVGLVMDMSHMVEQRDVSRDPVRYFKQYCWKRNGQWIIVQDMRRRDAARQGARPAERRAAPGAGAEAKAPSENPADEVSATEPDDPSVRFLRALARDNPVLMRAKLATDIPAVEASVDGGPYVELKAADRFKYADYGVVLNAKPGQKASFRVRFPVGIFVVTGEGIKAKEDKGALAGQIVYAKENPEPEDWGGSAARPEVKQWWIRAQILKDGVANIQYGTLKSPQLIQFVLFDWRRNTQAFRCNVFLRPVGGAVGSSPRTAAKDRPAVGKAADCIQAMLGDLEAMYDADRDGWLETCDSESLWQPADEALRALVGIDLGKYPHLAELMGKHAFTPWLDKVKRQVAYDATGEGRAKGKTQEECAKEVMDSLCYGGKLSQDLKSYGNRPTGWHSPRDVYTLAVFYERFPNLRQGNPLEKVLDYWVGAIAVRPTPVEHYGKGATQVDYRPEASAYAVAALQIGWKQFGKREYLDARDSVLAAMRKLPVPPRPFVDSRVWVDGEPVRREEAEKTELKWEPFYAAIDAGGRLPRDRNPAGYEPPQQAMAGFASAYGQACAFVGNEAELAKARVWVMAALNREGGEDEGPWRNYRAATFPQRCGLIALMRGEGGFLDVPEAK